MNTNTFQHTVNSLIGDTTIIIWKPWSNLGSGYVCKHHNKTFKLFYTGYEYKLSIKEEHNFIEIYEDEIIETLEYATELVEQYLERLELI